MKPGRLRVLASTAVILAGMLGLVGSAATGWSAVGGLDFEVQSLDGKGNNRARPEFGQAGTNYLRIAEPVYADGRKDPVQGPNPRFVSNRVFNDGNQNVFSERRMSQWASVWGQFIESDITLRAEGGPKLDIPFGANDPLESFKNATGSIPFTRSKIASGTGQTNPAQQVNATTSFIDASAVYGSTPQRLEFLRAGPVDGNLGNNSAFLLLPGGQLPRRDARGNVAKAPEMRLDGRLRGQANRAAVAGDVRANESTDLLAVHTLFAREHNRIVSLLPSSFTEEQKFQIARRVVIAEQQFITYNEFLPAMGVRLASYRGYKPDVNPTVSNEFATVGFRGSSLVDGAIEVGSEAERFPQAEQKALKGKGVGVGARAGGKEVAMEVPFNVASFNPDLLAQLQLGPVLRGLGEEAEQRNDEQIDNQLRSVLFQVPASGNARCLDGAELPKCFKTVLDIGALDIQRGRDHGMPRYNDMRRAFGLAPKGSFEEITDEASESFPTDPALTKGQEINDPDSLTFVKLLDADGKQIQPGSKGAQQSVVSGVRRTALAARLKAVYGSVDALDAYVGMLAAPHEQGSEFGELQRAMWKKQFEALRDGDRFFFLNDPGLSGIRRQFGIDFRQSLADIIVRNTDIGGFSPGDNIFFAENGFFAESGNFAESGKGDVTSAGSGSQTSTPAAGSKPTALGSTDHHGSTDVFVVNDRRWWWVV